MEELARLHGQRARAARRGLGQETEPVLSWGGALQRRNGEHLILGPEPSGINWDGSRPSQGPCVTFHRAGRKLREADGPLKPGLWPARVDGPRSPGQCQVAAAPSTSSRTRGEGVLGEKCEGGLKRELDGCPEQDLLSTTHV